MVWNECSLRRYRTLSGVIHERQNPTLSARDCTKRRKRAAVGGIAKLKIAEGGRTRLLAGFFAFDQASEVAFCFGVAAVFAPFIVFLDHVKNSLNGSTACGGFVVSKLRCQLVEEAAAHELNYTSVAVVHCAGVASEL